MPYDEPQYVERFEDCNLRLTLEYDSDPRNPREEDCNAATMVCFHGRYDLGDKHDYSGVADAIAGICGLDDDDLDYTREAHEAALNAAPIIWLPLYLYDHSGITMNTTGFHCPWDSGQVGIIYITAEKAAKDWPCDPTKETGDEWIERIKGYMRGEVKVYDHYLTNDVYGYVITPLDPDEDGDFEELDACWGFYGEEHAKEAGLEAIEALRS